MIRHAVTVVLASLVLFAGISVASIARTNPVLLPILRGAPIRLTGTLYPPNNLSCLLQQGTSRIVDPRTDQEVFSCEDAHGHGQVVWTGQTQLLDHVASGSGSLSVTDGIVYITVVRGDGGVQVETVPTP